MGNSCSDPCSTRASYSSEFPPKQFHDGMKTLNTTAAQAQVRRDVHFATFNETRRWDNGQHVTPTSRPQTTSSTKIQRPSNAVSSAEAACMRRQRAINANYQRPATSPNQVDCVSVSPVFPLIENGYIPGSSPRGEGQVHQCCTSAKLLTGLASLFPVICFTRRQIRHEVLEQF